jgi:threonine aldolase
MINFASENYAGVHPDIMKALADANTGHVPSYGNDEFTAEAVAQLKEVFGEDIEAYFTFNGTGANNFGIGTITERYHSVFCSDVAHLYVDESTAPESFIGCRIYPVKSQSGKIIPAELAAAIKRAGDIHHPQPRVVTITQPTEYGTVYSVDELAAIKQICTDNNLLLHADGARYFNAAEALGLGLKEITAGIDVLTLGGTKAGMMFGEAVIFFIKDDTHRWRYNLKRSMQLASKNRFIATQFTAMLHNHLWQTIAAHTNLLAREFEKQVLGITGISVAHPVQTNAVFVKMPAVLYLKLQQHACFYSWNELKQEVRFVFSFDNTLAEVEDFVKLIKYYTEDLNIA